MKIMGWIAGSVMLVAAGTAQAFQPAPIASTPDAAIIQVRGGCGFGEHRGRFGGCRLNRGPRGAIRRAFTGAPRGCPPGLIRGRYGRCHR